MRFGRFRDEGRSRRLRLTGGRWDDVSLVAVTSTGLLIETPTDPPLPLGTTRCIALDGLCGQTVVEARYPSVSDGRAFYAIKVIEHDPGLLAAIERASGVVHVSR